MWGNLICWRQSVLIGKVLRRCMYPRGGRRLSIRWQWVVRHWVRKCSSHGNILCVLVSMFYLDIAWTDNTRYATITIVDAVGLYRFRYHLYLEIHIQYINLCVFYMHLVTFKEYELLIYETRVSIVVLPFLLRKLLHHSKGNVMSVADHGDCWRRFGWP